jgi:hypothetical protein
MTAAQIAQRMDLALGRVQRLLEAERDRREIEHCRCDEVPVQIGARLGRSPATIRSSQLLL